MGPADWGLREAAVSTLDPGVAAEHGLRDGAFTASGACRSRRDTEIEFKAEITKDPGSSVSISGLKGPGEWRSLICE